MSKKYYPIEDAVNNVSQKFKLGLKDANEMDEEEFNNVEEYILKYVKLCTVNTTIVRNRRIYFVRMKLCIIANWEDAVAKYKKS